MKSLELGQLCSRLGVTKGSFYWHFSDMTAYRTALIDPWAVVRDEDRSFDDLTSLPAREWLSRMMTTLVGPRHWMLVPVCAAAAHVVHESRSVVADLLDASGVSAQFLDPPMQRDQRDVDVIAGHVVFGYDGSRELTV